MSRSHPGSWSMWVMGQKTKRHHLDGCVYPLLRCWRNLSGQIETPQSLSSHSIACEDWTLPLRTSIVGRSGILLVRLHHGDQRITKMWSLLTGRNEQKKIVIINIVFEWNGHGISRFTVVWESHDDSVFHSYLILVPSATDDNMKVYLADVRYVFGGCEVRCCLGQVLFSSLVSV